MERQQRQPYVPYTRQRNYACRITECTFRGLRCVVLENQVIRVSVAADKGADIYEFLHKPTDTEFLLRTPLGLRAQPPVLPTINLREGSFSDFYEGGWQELLPAAGDFPSESKGAQFGQHGEVALLPWSYHIKEDSPERIAVTFSVDTTRHSLSFRSHYGHQGWETRAANPREAKEQRRRGDGVHVGASPCFRLALSGRGLPDRTRDSTGAWDT